MLVLKSEPSNSKIVLAGPHLGENRNGISAGHANGGGQRRIIGPKERVGIKLIDQHGRDRRLAAPTHLLEFAGAGLQTRIVRIDAKRKASIRQSIFMAAKDPRRWRHAPQLQHRGPHLLHRAFEHPTASQCKQSVTAKQRVGVGEPKSYVAERMARRLIDHRLVAGDIDRIALAHGDVHIGDPGNLGFRTDQSGAKTLGQPFVAAGVIVVVMGVQDMGQGPAPRIQGRLDRRRLGGIDNRRHPAIRIMREIHIIVRHCRNQNDFERGHADISVYRLVTLKREATYHQPFAGANATAMIATGNGD